MTAREIGIIGYKFIKEQKIANALHAPSVKLPTTSKTQVFVKEISTLKECHATYGRQDGLKCCKQFFIYFAQSADVFLCCH